MFSFAFFGAALSCQIIQSLSSSLTKPDHELFGLLKVLAQLKKFARTVKSIREAVKPASSKQKALGSMSLDGDSEKKLNPNMDLSEMLRTDISGLDATVTGIAVLHVHSCYTCNIQFLKYVAQ